MKILITGCDGQLGREMRRVLDARMPGIATYTNRSTLDVTDRAVVIEYIAREQFTHIINCSGYTDVEGAETDPQGCRQVNVDAVSNLATAARETDARMIHISTDYVFDGKANMPYTESDRVNPLSEYGRSKRRGEMPVLDLANEGIVIRTSWLYSPYGNNFVAKMRAKALSGKDAKVVIDQVGSPTYAADLADAIYRILTSQRWIGGIYNYSNLGVCSWYDLAVEVFRYYGADAERVQPIRSHSLSVMAERPIYSVLDKSFIHNTYNIAIPYWTDSLEDCLKRIDAIERATRAETNG